MLKTLGTAAALGEKAKQNRKEGTGENFLG